MATRKENADLIKSELGLEIDTDKPQPLAGVLQGWADRLAADSAGVEREVLVFSLQSALGVSQIDPSASVEKLQAWLFRSETEPELVKAEVQPPDTSTLEIPVGSKFDPDKETFEVQVTSAVAGYGGTVTDPEQPAGHRVIGAEPVLVRASQIVTQALKNGTLLKA